MMGTIGIIGIVFLFSLMFGAMGLMGIVVLEIAMGYYTESDEFEGNHKLYFDESFILQHFGVFKIKINIIKFLYGLLIFNLCNILLLLMIFPIIDLFLWMLQIKYRTSVKVGKYLYFKRNR